jgi:RNA polymerase sigma factor (sigma-70 family)
LTDSELIKACLHDDTKAQKALYDRHAPVLMGVARRYMGNKAEAEDVLLTAFFKILTHLASYQGNGSFEGWMKRIVANEALMELRKRKMLTFGEELIDLNISETYDVHAQLSADEIMILIDKLPVGYRTVFNLFVLDGMSHPEIADLLGISVNTSKSQLNMARHRLQEWIHKMEKK